MSFIPADIKSVIFYLKILVLAAIGITCIFFFSCNKGEKFLGQTEFTNKVVISAYVSKSGAYFLISIDSTLERKVDVNNPNSLDQIFSEDYSGDGATLSHIRISWLNTDTVLLDTNVVLNGINNYYLIQLDKNQPPKFFFNFGEQGTSAPDSMKVKVRIYFEKDEEDPTPIPDTIKVQFYKIVGSADPYPDTSIIVATGQVSNYIELPDSYYKEGFENVHLAYKILNVNTGAVIQTFCTNFGYGVIDFFSQGLSGKGKYQTCAFDYRTDVSGCPNGTPTEEYFMDILFGGN